MLTINVQFICRFKLFANLPTYFSIVQLNRRDTVADLGVLQEKS